MTREGTLFNGHQPDEVLQFGCVCDPQAYMRGKQDWNEWDSSSQITTWLYMATKNRMEQLDVCAPWPRVTKTILVCHDANYNPHAFTGSKATSRHRVCYIGQTPKGNFPVSWASVQQVPSVSMKPWTMCVRTCALNISSMQMKMNESPALKSLRQAGIGLNVSQCDSCSNTYVSPTKH